MTTTIAGDSRSLITHAMRAAKAEAQSAGKCDGRCRTCIPDRLRACVERGNAIYQEAQPAHPFGSSEF